MTVQTSFAAAALSAGSNVSQTRQVSQTQCFSVVAEADPGMLPRVLELFAKRNLVPDRWVSDRLPGGGQLAVDLQVAGLEEAEAEHIARCLRQIWGVETVLRATKG